MFERTVDYEFAGCLPRKFYMPLRHSERSEESIMVEYAVSALCPLLSVLCPRFLTPLSLRKRMTGRCNPAKKIDRMTNAIRSIGYAVAVQLRDWQYPLFIEMKYHRQRSIGTDLECLCDKIDID